MTWACPPEVEDALWTAARDLLPASALAPAALRTAIIDRSLMYTSERARLGTAAPDPDADLAARALFFTIADTPKPMVPLAELLRARLLPTDSPPPRPRHRRRLRRLGSRSGVASVGDRSASARK